MEGWETNDIERAKINGNKEGGGWVGGGKRAAESLRRRRRWRGGHPCFAVVSMVQYPIIVVLSSTSYVWKAHIATHHGRSELLRAKIVDAGG